MTIAKDNHDGVPVALAAERCQRLGPGEHVGQLVVAAPVEHREVVGIDEALSEARDPR